MKTFMSRAVFAGMLLGASMLANAATPDKVETQLHKVVPEAWLPKAHHWLILHGRYTCLAQRPKCSACVILDLCPSRASFMGV